MGKQNRKKEDRMMIEEIRAWANSDDCDCEDSWETFEKCCGKGFDLLQNLQTWGSKERVCPRFKDLDPESQKKILEVIGRDQ